jgi:hypothetical protein
MLSTSLVDTHLPFNQANQYGFNFFYLPFLFIVSGHQRAERASPVMAAVRNSLALIGLVLLPSRAIASISLLFRSRYLILNTHCHLPVSLLLVCSCDSPVCFL